MIRAARMNDVHPPAIISIESDSDFTRIKQGDFVFSRSGHTTIYGAISRFAARGAIFRMSVWYIRC